MDDISFLDDALDATLKPILQRLSARAGFTITLTGLAQRWAALVASVERGYADSIYEYANDVAVRNLLRQIEAALPPDIRVKLALHLESLDERFMIATTESRGVVRGLDPVD